MYWRILMSLNHKKYGGNLITPRLQKVGPMSEIVMHAVSCLWSSCFADKLIVICLQSLSSLMAPMAFGVISCTCQIVFEKLAKSMLSNASTF